MVATSADWKAAGKACCSAVLKACLREDETACLRVSTMVAWKDATKAVMLIGEWAIVMEVKKAWKRVVCWADVMAEKKVARKVD